MATTFQSFSRKPLMPILRIACAASLVVAASLSGSLILGVESQSPSQSTAQYAAKPYPARFSLIAERAGTAYVGKETKVSVVLLDQFGKPLDAPWNIPTTLVVTTLDNPERATKWLDDRPTKQTQQPVTKDLRVVLQPGQEAARITYVHGLTQEDMDVKITSHQKGQVLVFAESQNIARGETFLFVLDRSYAPQIKRSSTQAPAAKGLPPIPTAGAFLMPIMWQEPHQRQWFLQILPRKREPPFYPEPSGGHYAEFDIALKPDPDTDDLVPAPAKVTIELNVEGNARFEARQLTISQGALRPEQPARLFCVPGGPVSFTASANWVDGIKVHKDNKELTFPPGRRATKLKLSSHPDSALANGLDAITITAETVQEYRDHEEARTPEEEGMRAGRTVSFHIEGDARGTSFVSESGTPELTIAKDSPSGSIKLLGRRSASGLKVIATSKAGDGTRITNTDDVVVVSFSFPWVAFGFALFGGLLFPLLQRKDLASLRDKSELLKLAQGLALGGLFFALAMFGAISSNPTAIESVAVTITRIPTENPLGALAIGFLGSVLWGGLFALAAFVKKKAG